VKRTIEEFSLKGLTFDLVDFAGDHKAEGEKLFINIGQEPINLMQDEDVLNILDSRLVNDARFVSRFRVYEIEIKLNGVGQANFSLK
jgi:hypothetical protein